MHKLNELIENLKVRNKLLLLVLILLLPLIANTFLTLKFISQVKIGGKLYGQISVIRESLETLALLKSDLNYVRVELLTLLIATNQNALDISVAKLHDLSSNIDTSFARASKQIPVEEVTRSLAEANATWQDFRQTRDIDLISAVRSGDIALAKQLADGVQKRRFNRFIEQTGGAIDVLTLKIVEFEKRASEKVAVTMRLMLLISVIPTAIALSLAFMIIGSIEKPLFEVMKAIAALGNGDLSKSCSVHGGLDEHTDAWR